MGAAWAAHRRGPIRGAAWAAHRRGPIWERRGLLIGVGRGDMELPSAHGALDMESNGSTWSRMDRHGVEWIDMESNGSTWSRMDRHGVEWIDMESLGFFIARTWSARGGVFPGHGVRSRRVLHRSRMEREGGSFPWTWSPKPRRGSHGAWSPGVNGSRAIVDGCVE
jgi:hypothetical protein